MGKYNPIFYLYYRMIRLYRDRVYASRSMIMCLCFNMWTFYVLVDGNFDEIVGLGIAIIIIFLVMYTDYDLRKIVRLYYGESEECRVRGNVFTVLYIIGSILLPLLAIR